jgi:hypothetical protein
VAAARATLPNSEDWDAGTHMTKKDWERTCGRLAQERTKFVTKFLMEQPK